MNIEDMLTKKIYSLTRTLDILKRELDSLFSDLKSLSMEIKPLSEVEKKEMQQLLIKIKGLELKIADAKKELNEATDQIVFVMSLENKSDLSKEEALKLQQLSQINALSSESISDRNDYSVEEAVKIHQEFKNNDAPTRGSR